MSKCTRIVDNSVALLVECATHYNIRCYDTQLTVLLGQCHINGYTATPTTPPLNISSLDSQSRLALNAPKTRVFTAPEIQECLKNTCFKDEPVCDPGNIGAVVLIQPATDTKTALLRSTYKRLWDSDSQNEPLVKLDYFELYGGLNNALQIGSEWSAAVNSLVSEDRQERRIAICGPKNAGKSTLCRFTVNTLLGKFKAVLFLETDIGQSEFTPAGLVTLSLIRSPLLNPPFANRPAFVRSLKAKHGHGSSEGYCIGTVSPGQVMEEYMERAVTLINKGRKLCTGELPLVVNNMGWTKGFGVALHADIMRTLQPTHVMNLQTSTPKDLPPIAELLVTPGILPYDGEALPIAPKILNLPGHCSPSKTDRAPFQAFELRHMALLSYFSPVYSSTTGGVTSVTGGVTSVTSVTGGVVAPYKVSWNHVAVVLPEDVEHELAAYTLNCSVVALLTGAPVEVSDGIRVVGEEAGMVCLGLGIVRAVDVNEKVFYINTPLDPGLLEQVFVLKHTSLPVPHLPSGSLPVPYLNNLAASEIMGIGSRSQRANLKRRYHTMHSGAK